ncbi:MAG: ACT domain-containing protein [Clostridia bacterium]|nr:ACT domain-containing protein [Clostridia bacterium]
MKIKVIEYSFTVCKIMNISDVDFNDEFCFVGKTDEELSLVCRTEKVPDNITEREDSWKAFRIEGILELSMIGILSKISAILAENRIGIFVISTYNTDYIMVKKENFEKALKVLKEKGYEVLL